MNIYIQRLVRLRRESGKSQSDIALVLETTQQQISKYENEIQELPVRHLIRLAEYYGVSLDYIAGLSEEKQIK